MKLSIITINYNNREGLRKTMESVFAQSCKDFEYIVIDGASTDGSVDIIKEYEHWLSSTSAFTLTWSSEPDNGIYNAMNKGIEIAMGKRKVNEFNRSELVEDKNKGIEIAQGIREVDSFNRSTLCGDKNKGVRAAKSEYLLMLNSGDYLVDNGVIECILPELDGTDIIQGNIIDGNKRNRGYGKSDINFIDVQQAHFLHQASFCKRTLFELYGYFDESYKIDGDTVFYIRCLGKGNATFRYVDQDIAFFEGGGMSDHTNEKWAGQRALEFRRWSTEEFSKRQWDTCIELDKKNRLYDKLHSHRWAWNIVMLITRIIDMLDRYESNR